MFCTWVSSLWSLVWNVSSDSARVMTLRILIGQSFQQRPLIGWDRAMCSCVRACYCDPGWHQWHLLTPDTNCFHLSLQSYQESLTNTNWHVIPSMWEKWRMFELRPSEDHMRAVGLCCHTMTNAHTHICNHFVKTSIISTLSCKTFYQVSEKFDSTAAKSWRVG